MNPKNAAGTYFADDAITLWHGDALETLQRMGDGTVDCVITSPPYYGLRDYGVAGQYGLEASPSEYVETMRAVFGEARRVLADDGTLWLNIGDSYSGSWGNQSHDPDRPDLHVGVRSREALPSSTRTGSQKPGAPGPKNLYGIPWRTAFALQDDGWILRNEIIWAKSNCMPESVTDRLSGKHEHVFLFAKSRRYWFDLDAIREPISETTAARYERPINLTHHTPGDGRTKRWERQPVPGQRAQNGDRRAADSNGRNPGDVWTLPTQPFTAAHFAAMPPALARRCVSAGCRPGGTVLDPFHGSGTTGAAALQLGRRYVGIELNAEYLDLSLRTRLAQGALIEPDAAVSGGVS